MSIKHLALSVSFSVENGFKAALLVAPKRYSQVFDENRQTKLIKMKNKTIVIVAIFVSLILMSCKKDHECWCGGSRIDPYAPELIIHNTKREAKKECQDYFNNVASKSAAIEYCEIK